MKILLFGVLIGGVLIAACSGGNSPPDSAPSETVYTLAAAAEVGDLGFLQVSGATTLPNGSVLVVTTTRINILFGETSPRFFDVGSVPAVVQDGAFGVSYAVNDRGFLDFNAMLVEPATSLRDCFCVERVLPEVQVEVLFDPRDQSEEIMALVGATGDALVGSPDLFVFGSATATPTNMLRSEFRTELLFSLRDELQQQIDAARRLG